MAQRSVVIMGAAGKDFHVFNTCFRDDAARRVVAFTATQIPGIDDRRYPPALAGRLYPSGIPIVPEEDLPSLIEREKVQDVVFAYSDVSYAYVEDRAKVARRAGATFDTFDVDRTMLASCKPVIAVCAVRTGCGKSQTSRRILTLLRARGYKVVAIRHPMPYGDLEKQAVQRFATLGDLKTHECSIEEMEEYEPHIRHGHVVYAGVDYGAILAAAEKEADIILWDGGNNDTPFYRPKLYITVADALRPGHELDYFPGRVNFERAHLIVINKCDSGTREAIEQIEKNAARLNPGARILRAESPVTVSDPARIKGKRVLVVEDGPTLTHGGMKFGAGVVAAEKCGAAAIIDPRPFAVGSIAATYAKYPETGKILPAMGYGDQQIKDLAATIDRADCDVVVIGTPIDLGRVIQINKPSVRVTYELSEQADKPLLEAIETALSR
ncbi:MAG: GTPase [Planctomycetes bacterium]|nr:GTPase [Planctomycetota bacterium]